MSEKEIKDKIKRSGSDLNIAIEEVISQKLQQQKTVDALVKQVETDYNEKEELNDGITHKAIVILKNSVYYFIYIVLVFVLLSLYQQLFIRESSIIKIFGLIILYCINLGLSYLILNNNKGTSFTTFISIIVPILFIINFFPLFVDEEFGFKVIPGRGDHQDTNIFQKLFYISNNNALATRIESTIVVVQIIVVIIVCITSTPAQNVMTRLPSDTQLKPTDFDSKDSKSSKSSKSK